MTSHVDGRVFRDKHLAVNSIFYHGWVHLFLASRHNCMPRKAAHTYAARFWGPSTYYAVGQLQSIAHQSRPTHPGPVAPVGLLKKTYRSTPNET